MVLEWCPSAKAVGVMPPRSAELSAAQLAKPSYWDEVGPDKPNASALKAALADTVLVDAAWLARLADEGGILPRCQDLPPGARVTLEEMEKWDDGGSTLGVLVISYPWWAPPHLNPRNSSAVSLLHLQATHALPPCWCTGSTPTTRTRTGCSCARSRTC